MSRLRVNAFGMSIDGYGAGPDQSLENPMGVGGMALHQWVFGTKTFQRVLGDTAAPLAGAQPPRGGVDDDFAARGFENLGAWIIGRNMFAPSRGPWPEDGWKGWCGDEPPYHVPVFVLTHHARARRSRCGAGPRSTSSPTASAPPWSGRGRRREARTSGWAGASPPSASTSPRGSSTRST